jgi:DNA polymerase-4
LTLDRPTDDAGRIYQAALVLFERIWPVGQPVRLLGVGASGLSEQIRQLGLWDDVAPLEPDPEDDARQERLRTAIELLRSRFGDGAVQRASDLSPPHDW